MNWDLLPQMIESGEVQFTITSELYADRRVYSTGEPRRHATLQLPVTPPTSTPYLLLRPIKGELEEVAADSEPWELTWKVDDNWFYHEDKPDTHWHLDYSIRKGKSIRDPYLYWYCSVDEYKTPAEFGIEPLSPDEHITCRTLHPHYRWLTHEECWARAGWNGGPVMDLSMLHYTVHHDDNDRWSNYPRWQLEDDMDSKWFNPQGMASLNLQRRYM